MNSFIELLDSSILNKKGQPIDVKTYFNGKVIGLYFSAHWCPPCKAFTPLLVDFYNKYHKEKNLEIIFVSADSNERSFKGYYSEMPWLQLDYDRRDLQDQLSENFDVSGIPKLVLVDGTTGEILNDDARLKIQYEDKEGSEFPWRSSLPENSQKSSRRRRKKHNEEGCALI
jgi:nucleoredoxin